MRAVYTPIVLLAVIWLLVSCTQLPAPLENMSDRDYGRNGYSLASAGQGYSAARASYDNGKTYTAESGNSSNMPIMVSPPGPATYTAPASISSVSSKELAPLKPLGQAQSISSTNTYASAAPIPQPFTSPTPQPSTIAQPFSAPKPTITASASPSYSSSSGIGSSTLPPLQPLSTATTVASAAPISAPTTTYAPTLTSPPSVASAAPTPAPQPQPYAQAVPVQPLNAPAAPAVKDTTSKVSVDLFSKDPSTTTTAAPAPASPQKIASASNSKSRFIWPVQGSLLSKFGKKPDGLYNDGINIAAEEGEPIWAAADGTVVYAGNQLKGYGNMVMLRHDGGWVTTYAHASQLTVHKDDQVRQGQLIGYVGSTGSVDTAQLHFGIREGTAPVDPEQFLSRDVAGLQ